MKRTKVTQGLARGRLDGQERLISRTVEDELSLLLWDDIIFGMDTRPELVHHAIFEILYSDNLVFIEASND